MLLSGVFSLAVFGIFQNNFVDAVAMEAERVGSVGEQHDDEIEWSFEVLVDSDIDPSLLAQLAVGHARGLEPNILLQHPAAMKQSLNYALHEHYSPKSSCRKK